ncbi:MAG: T9SS type A sorting domain-containing protein [Bacteroidales bacterium]|jgi:hypothetical protein|nr:T9SS type A sorting domain-containing protein [Bacteroidales bacterium]
MKAPLYIRAFTEGISIDTIPINDSTVRPKALTTMYSDTTKIYIEPAYEVKAVSIVTDGHIGSRCDLRHDTIRVQIKNTGHYLLTAENTQNWKMSYQVEGRSPVTELVNWPFPDASIAPNATETYTFRTLVNLYPQNFDIVDVCDSSAVVWDTMYRDTIYKVRAWSRLPLDSIFENDTTGHVLTAGNNAAYTVSSAWTSINSYADPIAPHAHNDTIYFGTYGHTWADQTQYLPTPLAHLVVHWFKDSTDRNSEINTHTGTNLAAYLASQIDSTIRLFRDTTYYLMATRTGAYPCTSKFTPISVIIRPRVPIDLSLEQVIEPYYVDTNYNNPVTPSWVYMTEHDTVKVRIANYGTETAYGGPYFKLWYSIKPTTPANAPEVVKGEALFFGEIPPFNAATGVTDPNNYVDFAFPYTFPYASELDSLNDMSFNFLDPSKTYQIKTWLNVMDDYIPVNDTLGDSIGRTKYFAKIKPRNGENIYPTTRANVENSLDISRVRLGVLNNYSVPIGNTYTNYTHDADTAIIYKGVRDSLYVSVDISTAMDVRDTIVGFVKAFIDWNRDGSFDDNPTEKVMSLPFKIIDGQGVTVASGINPNPTLNPNIINGYTRMRVIVFEDKKVDAADMNPNEVFEKGEAEDYLVQIRTIDSNNAALYWFSTPIEFNDKGKDSVSIMARNLGLNPLQSGTTINWSNNGGTTWKQPYVLSQTDLDALNATGSWRNIKVADDFPIDTGLTHFVAYISAPADEVHYNDTVGLMSYLFERHTLPYTTNFDSTGVNDRAFYAWEPNYEYPSNCWEIGKIVPASKQYVKQANTPENCIVTDLDDKYPKNNVSIIYSPVFDINVVKPDTLTFMLSRYVASGALMKVEYKSKAASVWRTLGTKNDGYGINWYNNANNNPAGFITITDKTWTKVSYSLYHLVQEGRIYASDVQFRFVFRSNNNAPSDGFAIDDFTLNRALYNLDAGAVAIATNPEMPNYGDSIYPKVCVKNLGRDPLTSFMVHYKSFEIRDGQNNPMYLEKEREINNVNIAPGDSIWIDMQPVYVGAETPPRFTLIARAYNMNEPLPYRDNDTAKLLVTVAPLLNDVGVRDLIYPKGSVAINEAVAVKIKVRNFGVVRQNTIPIVYKLSSGATLYRDTIHLNTGLAYGEEYTYTFRQTFTAHTGTVDLKVWTALDGDMYHENDTMGRRVPTNDTIKDLVADVVIIDDYDPNSIGVQLNFINSSFYPVSSIKVGYYTNDNPSNAVIEDYHGGEILGTAHGYHTFTARLPRQYYSGICGFVKVDGDADNTNDTTCTRYFGYSDASADSILIEEQDRSTCRVQVFATNRGSLGSVNRNVRYHIELNGEEVHSDNYMWGYDVPGASVHKIMTYEVPRSENHTYNIRAWIDYPNDANHANDTTSTYRVANEVVGLYDIDSTTDRFILDQNVPNPLDNETEIGFALPYDGKISLFIANNEGKIVYTTNGSYSAGRHSLKLDKITLPQGVYFYTMEFDGAKLTRKMLISR